MPKIKPKSAGGESRVAQASARDDEARLNVEVPVDLHTRLKVRAAQERTTVKELVMESLEAYLRE